MKPSLVKHLCLAVVLWTRVRIERFLSFIACQRGCLIQECDYSVNQLSKELGPLWLIRTQPMLSLSRIENWPAINLVDPASSHMLVSKIKPCMSQYKLLHGETANGSLKQL